MTINAALCIPLKPELLILGALAYTNLPSLSSKIFTTAKKYFSPIQLPAKETTEKNLERKPEIAKIPSYLGSEKESPTASRSVKNQPLISLEDSSNDLLTKVTYKYETESKIYRIAKNILSWIFLPFTLFHYIGGKIILPASLRSKEEATKFRTTEEIKRVSDKPIKWDAKRVTIEVNGDLIDAMLLTREETANNGRWILKSTGNTGIYEIEKFLKHESSTTKQIADLTDSNILLFNYPGVGASEGSPNRKKTIDTYKAMLHYLEDKEKGLKANTIIAHGLSLGGGIQGEGFDSHELKPDLDYIMIKDRTFSTLAKAAGGIFFPLGLLTRVLGWNIDTISGSKKLKAHEIILQTADVTEAREIKESKLLAKTDGVITKEASLAYALLEDSSKEELLKNKTVIGIPEDHNANLNDYTVSLIALKIKEVFEKKQGLKVA